MMVELWTRKREMGDEDENDMRIQAAMRNQEYHLPDWVRRPRIGVNTHRIATRTCRIGDGQLTPTRNSLSPSFS